MAPTSPAALRRRPRPTRRRRRPDHAPEPHQGGPDLGPIRPQGRAHGPGRGQDGDPRPRRPDQGQRRPRRRRGDRTRRHPSIDPQEESLHAGYASRRRPTLALADVGRASRSSASPACRGLSLRRRHRARRALQAAVADEPIAPRARGSGFLPPGAAERPLSDLLPRARMNAKRLDQGKQGARHARPAAPRLR